MDDKMKRAIDEAIEAGRPLSVVDPRIVAIQCELNRLASEHADTITLKPKDDEQGRR